jgi:hypothetical protein
MIPSALLSTGSFQERNSIYPLATLGLQEKNEKKD